MRLFYYLLPILCGTQLSAQEQKVYKVNPGEKVNYALLHNKGLYQYPQFTNASVLFKNGHVGGGALNYNRLIGEMQFIDEKKDTISLSDENEIDTIAIGKDTFFFQQGYLQLMHNFSVKIAKKTKLILTNRQRLGSMGELTSASVDTYNAVSSDNGIKNIAPNEILTFKEVTTYFIGDRFGHFKPLNKKYLYDFYFKDKKALDTYLQANPVNYLQEEDVQRLVSFLKTL